MMRKYVKPRIQIEKLQLNQAIASCSKGQGSFTVEWIGYGLSATGGYSVALQDKIKDYKEACNKYLDPNQGRTEATICRVYYITNGTCSAYYEDYPTYDGEIYAIASGLNWGGPVDGNNWQCVVAADDKVIGSFMS